MARLRRAVAGSGDDPASLAPALHAYLRVHTGAAGPERWEQELRERGAAAGQVQELRDLLAGLDAARYGAAGGAGPADPLGGRILRWAAAVDPALGGGSRA